MFQHDAAHTGYTNSTPIKSKPEVLWRYQTESPISSSLAVSEDLIYVSDQSTTYAINASTGSKVWDARGAGLSVAAVDKGIVYTTDNGGTAYNASNGAILWSYKSGSGYKYSPTAADGVVYMSSNDTFYAIKEDTKTVIWNFSGEASTSPAVSNDRVYLGGRCFNASTGDFLWVCHPVGFITSPLTVYGNRVYFGSDDNNLYCIDAVTGLKIWNYTTNDIVTSSPAVADGRVFVGSCDGNVYALNATTGEKIWNYQTGAAVESSPAIASDVVYIGSDNGNLYAFDAASGANLWSFPVQGKRTDIGLSRAASPVVSNGVIYMGSSECYVYALKPNGNFNLPIVIEVLSLAVIIITIALIVRKRKPKKSAINSKLSA